MIAQSVSGRLKRSECSTNQTFFIASSSNPRGPELSENTTFPGLLGAKLITPELNLDLVPCGWNMLNSFKKCCSLVKAPVLWKCGWRKSGGATEWERDGKKRAERLGRRAIGSCGSWGLANPSLSHPHHAAPRPAFVWSQPAQDHPASLLAYRLAPPYSGPRPQHGWTQQGALISHGDSEAAHLG